MSKYICFLICVLITGACNASNLISCGSSSLDVTVEKHYEGQSVFIRIFDSEGKKLLFPILINKGKFLSLCEQSKFLLINDTAHYKPGASFLMRYDGQVLASFEFGLIASIEKSEDDKLFWVQNFDILEDRRPVTILNVYNEHGDSVVNQTFKNRQIYSLNVNDVEYHISIKAPEYPG